ncbi:MAG: MBL fold metallo-hydrolase [Lewinellaceae bacterium]|nr:MBL fold metallo-hydrolase [Lewinellaceae bacterium]
MIKSMMLGSLLLLVSQAPAQLTAVKNTYFEAEMVFREAEMNLQPGLYGYYKIEASGNEYVEGHLESPGQSDTALLNITIEKKAVETYAVNLNMDYRGKKYLSGIVFSGDSCAYMDYGDTVAVKQSVKAHALIYFYSPYNLVKTIQKNIRTLHLVDAKDENFKILGFNDEYGNKFYTRYDRTKKEFTALWMPAYDPVLGDYFETLAYEDYRCDNGFCFPVRITHQKATGIYRTIAVTNIQFDRNDKEKPARKEMVEIEMDTISNHLFLIKLLNFNNKMMVSKHRNYLSVYDAPINIAVCRQVISFLHEKFPDHPVKYCYLSHHHPDHAGGAGAFMETGCRIVTTPGNIAYFNRIFQATHTMEGRPVNTTKAAGPLFDEVAVNKNRRFDGDDYPVVACETGASTGHTKEYLLFYFPEDKVLFAADLVLFYKNGIYNQGERALSVYKFIEGEKLPVERIFTGWPLHHFNDYGTVEDIKACLKAKYPGL